MKNTILLALLCLAAPAAALAAAENADMKAHYD